MRKVMTQVNRTLRNQVQKEQRKTVKKKEHTKLNQLFLRAPTRLLLLLAAAVVPHQVMLEVLILVEAVVVYFGMLGKTRKRYRRAYQVRGPSLEQQIVDDVVQDGPREYTLVKERKPRSTPIKRRKKRGPRLRAGRRGGVCRRMIIDIHLEILDECHKGDMHSTKEDFFEILAQEFMTSEFIKEEKFPCSGFGFREVNFVPKEDVPVEQFPSSDSGFREKNFVPKEDVPVEQFPSSDSGFRVYVLKERVPKEEVLKEQVSSLDFGFRVDISKEQVRCSDSGFREEDSVPKDQVPSLDSGFRQKTLFLRKMFLMNRFTVQIPGLGKKTFFLRKKFLRNKFLWLVPSSDLGFREEDFAPEDDVPEEQVRSSDSGYRV
ncbi:SICA antigen [Plasmodium coatneyi]|uniref:SICA antigen n=1 Tax=Plasmodium coatneyi TaxID=208452 RepID=A0A1B1E6V4_9APIC|nr:SICA antigen [Plasmodium coatneyi]ANQ10756.1 SICA antigen [Plasmodium coatneyi]